MKYTVRYSSLFKKSYKKCLKRGYDENLFRHVVFTLANNGKLPVEFKPHRLKGNYVGCWECHIQPDWLLVWEQNDSNLTLLLVDTGTHSDLFDK